MKTLSDIPERKKITVEVLKEIGYHDVHQIGDIIQVAYEHLEDLIEKGFVRVVGSED